MESISDDFARLNRYTYVTDPKIRLATIISMGFKVDILDVFSTSRYMKPVMDLYDNRLAMFKRAIVKIRNEKKRGRKRKTRVVYQPCATLYKLLNQISLEKVCINDSFSDVGTAVRFLSLMRLS